MWELNHKEGWALKNWCFWAVVLEKILESPWTARKSNQSIVKKISLEFSLEGLMLKLKLQYFGHLMRTDSLEKALKLGKTEGRSWRGRRRMRSLDGFTDSTDMNESEQAPGVGDGQGGLACCSPRVLKESDTRDQLNEWDRTGLFGERLERGCG